MANTSPGHRHRRGRAARPRARSRGRPGRRAAGRRGHPGLGGEELAELGLMARSRARVRVFSDDGKCVHDARVMRRALEYVKAFGGVVSQHAQDPTLAGPAVLLPRGRAVRPPRAARLARHRRGGHRRPRRDAGAPHRLARPRRPRLDRRHRRGAALGQVAGHRRHRRGHAAPPAAHHRPARRLRPDVQGQPAAASRRRTSTRCGRRWPTAPSTPSRPTTPRTPGTTRSTRSPTRPSACSGWRRRWASSGRRCPDLSWARVAQVMSTTPARIAGLADHGSLALGHPGPRRPWSTPPRR